MPRPRVYELDSVLDAAESLAGQAGAAGVTTRAVAAAAGVSNGAIYHNFGSRAELVARTWLRAAGRFLDVQTELVDEVLATPGVDPVEAVVAAADAPAEFAHRHPQSSRLLWRIPRDQLLAPDLSESLSAELGALESDLIALMIRLSMLLWDRRDGVAVDAVTLCIVDLPTSIILSRNRITNTWARDRLKAAVRAVLAEEPTKRSKKS
ncbi:AcrR family transcriptional regulator [Mycobacterium sp. MAA66]|uniref:helix-turn-helix domain-containing protein n=1 Tax=Mycobacterium sp. MAA66 TaxID=3156297 RepID=UPI003518351D